MIYKISKKKSKKTKKTWIFVRHFHLIIHQFFDLLHSIRNEKIAWKVVWIDYYLLLNLNFRRYSDQATSNFIKFKNSMCWNISSFYYSDINVSSFYYSDTNLFLIDYPCCRLYNMLLLLFEKNSRSYYYTRALQWRKKVVVLITQDRWWMIGDRWQFKKGN